MSNYYEFLKVQPTASQADIQTALDQMYNQSRRLVTHHDPQVVQVANQDLLKIEQARSTLLDPSKRADYDAMLSLSTIGGLADLTAQPAPMQTAAPPMIRSATVPPVTPQISVPVNDAWACPKCKTVNQIGTKFCKKCGTQLGRNCPKCSALVETNAEFCSDCGVNIRQYEKELELAQAEAERQRIAEERRIAEWNASMGVIIKASTDATKYMKWGWIVTVIGLCIPFVGIISLGLFALSITNAQKVLRQSQQPGDTEYRSKAKTALTLSVIPLGLAVLVMAFWFLILVGGAFSN
jgi:hypothetical protein